MLCFQALSQQDGTWKYGADEDVSTAKAAGNNLLCRVYRMETFFCICLLILPNAAYLFIKDTSRVKAQNEC